MVKCHSDKYLRIKSLTSTLHPTWLGTASSALGGSGKEDLFDTHHLPSLEALHFNTKDPHSFCSWNKGQMACPIQQSSTAFRADRDLSHWGRASGAWLYPVSLQAVAPASGSLQPELLDTLVMGLASTESRP